MPDIFSLEEIIELAGKLKWEEHLRGYYVASTKKGGKEYFIGIARDDYLFFYRRYVATIREKGRDVETTYISSKLKQVYNKLWPSVPLRLWRKISGRKK